MDSAACEHAPKIAHQGQPALKKSEQSTGGPATAANADRQVETGVDQAGAPPTDITTSSSSPPSMSSLKPAHVASSPDLSDGPSSGRGGPGEHRQSRGGAPSASSHSTGSTVDEAADDTLNSGQRRREQSGGGRRGLHDEQREHSDNDQSRARCRSRSRSPVWARKPPSSRRRRRRRRHSSQASGHSASDSASDDNGSHSDSESSSCSLPDCKCSSRRPHSMYHDPITLAKHRRLFHRPEHLPWIHY